jgi:hypothetical protein
VDRNRVDADPDTDPDPTFHFDTDPDPDPTPDFTHGGKTEILTFVHCRASLNCLIFFVSVITVRKEIHQPVDAKMRQLF